MKNTMSAAKAMNPISALLSVLAPSSAANAGCGRAHKAPVKAMKPDHLFFQFIIAIPPSDLSCSYLAGKAGNLPPQKNKMPGQAHTRRPGLIAETE